eukprot:EG_transcript_26363
MSASEATQPSSSASSSPAPTAPPTKGQVMGAFFAVLRSNGPVANKLLAYTVAMFTLPVAVFLFLDRVLLLDFDLEPNVRNTIAAVVAVVTVQVIIALYVISAMLEPDPPPAAREPGPKED